MSENVELSSLDLRYEGHRLRDDAREARVLASIVQRGIEEPLEGVDTCEARFLLNGFKRCRCAKKLGLDCVPYLSLGAEEATGILSLMRVSKDKALGILEQARFLADLLSIHGMSVAEVAQMLSRSKGCNEFERVLLNDLQGLQRSMRRVMAKCCDPRLEGRAFYAQANLLSGGLLSTLEPFSERMKELYDRSGHA
jgi:hypothetical protein